MSNNEKKFYLTINGLKEVQNKYNKLKMLKTVRAQQNFPVIESEAVNSEFIDFREDNDVLEAELLELENILKHAEIIKSSFKKDKDVVYLGSTVELEESNNREGKNKKNNLKFTIVGTFESDPFKGKISNESPLGQALLGRRKGEEVDVLGKRYRIKKIKYELI